MGMLNIKMHFISFNSYRRGLLLLPLMLTLIMTSCGKGNAFDLFQSTGPMVRKQRETTGYFNKISLNDDINLMLTQGYPTMIEVEGGNNLLSDITTEISNSTLTIRNLNKYNWVRSYDKKITVYLQVSHLSMIRYESSGNITTTDTIHEDSLHVEAWAGSGTIAMALDCGTIWLIQQYGSMDFDVCGKSSVTYIYAGSYGAFHCLGLKSYNTFIRNDGTNDCYVNAIERIDADIRSLGNIYYSGRPVEANRVGSGSGKLIHLE